MEKRLVDQQSASDEKIRSLTDQLSQEVAKVSSMMQQLVDYMMGKGSVTLSDTLRDSVVAGVREEVRREFQGIIDEKDARIASLEAQINHPDGTEVESGERNDEREATTTTIRRSRTNLA